MAYRRNEQLLFRLVQLAVSNHDGGEEDVGDIAMLERNRDFGAPPVDADKTLLQDLVVGLTSEQDRAVRRFRGDQELCRLAVLIVGLLDRNGDSLAEELAASQFGSRYPDVSRT